MAGGIVTAMIQSNQKEQNRMTNSTLTLQELLDRHRDDDGRPDERKVEKLLCRFTIERTHNLHDDLLWHYALEQCVANGILEELGDGRVQGPASDHYNSGQST